MFVHGIIIQVDDAANGNLGFMRVIRILRRQLSYTYIIFLCAFAYICIYIHMYLYVTCNMSFGNLVILALNVWFSSMKKKRRMIEHD